MPRTTKGKAKGTAKKATTKTTTSKRSFKTKAEILSEQTGIPVGLCQCGCGKRTGVAVVTATKKRHIAGALQAFAIGHFPKEKRRKKQLLQCKHDGCPIVAQSLGLCEKHYAELRRNQGKMGTCLLCGSAKMNINGKVCRTCYLAAINGTEDDKKLVGIRIKPQCSVPGCSRAHKGLGYCEMHLDRFKKYGDPGHPGPTKKHYKNGDKRLVQQRFGTRDVHVPFVKVPGHPNAVINGALDGFVKESRMVASAMTGRPLEEYEHVWHLDGDPTNNSPSNLLVKEYGRTIDFCYTCGDVIKLNPGRWTATAKRQCKKCRKGAKRNIGEACSLTKMSRQQVETVILLRSKFLGLRNIADKMGCSYGAVQAIVSGKTWKHIPRPDGLGQCTPRRSALGNKLSAEKVLKIKQLLAKGCPQHVVARKFSISQSMVSKIKCGISWSLTLSQRNENELETKAN